MSSPANFNTPSPAGEGWGGVLLHCCCAPCSAAIIEWMMQNDMRPTLYYCNPNIYPEEEYLIRKNELTRYATKLGLTVIDDDYDHAGWLRHIQGLEQEPERGKRCLQCFKYRLLRTARKAQELHLPLFTTTLASSRWKRLDQIEEAGRWAEAATAPATVPCNSIAGQETSHPATVPCDSFAGQETCTPATSPSSSPLFLARNWRKGGLQERRNQLLKEHNFYNQLYCGCEFSMR